MKCENCGCEHDGSYGSGRFCSKECGCSFNAKKVKTHKCNFKHKTSPYGTWCCSRCNLVFRTRSELTKHNRSTHPIPKGSSWNKGLTSETDERIKQRSIKIKSGFESGRLKSIWIGKNLSNEHKKKISESMKKAHSEGRAHNIGECRWNNEPSYPEKFFMEVIENEFINKNYVREKPFGRFSLDFAWCDLKRCIEIDGKQHETDEKQKLRDVAKDKLLHEEGWEVLRIKWSDMFNDPKSWIQIAKDFIDK